MTNALEENQACRMHSQVFQPGQELFVRADKLNIV